MAIATLTDKRYSNRVLSALELGYFTGTAIAFLLLDSRDVQFDEQITTLTTQGTVTTHEKDTVEAFRVNLANQVYQKALSRAMLMDPVTTGITGVAERTGYDGRYRSENLMLRVSLQATDLATGQDVLFRYTFWKMQHKQYRPFAGATARQVPEQTVQLTAIPTTVDIAGAAILGLKNATTGDYYSEDLVA